MKPTGPTCDRIIPLNSSAWNRRCAFSSEDGGENDVIDDVLEIFTSVNISYCMFHLNFLLAKVICKEYTTSKSM